MTAVRPCAVPGCPIHGNHTFCLRHWVAVPAALKRRLREPWGAGVTGEPLDSAMAEAIAAVEAKDARPRKTTKRPDAGVQETDR